MVMSKTNYKVHAEVDTRGEVPTRLLKILDSGEGPNFIRRTELPQGVSHVLQDASMLNICDASGSPVRMVGMAKLEVKIGQDRLAL